MKKTCENCPNATRCTEMCEDIKKLLEEPKGNYIERPVSNIFGPGTSEDEEDEAGATVDDFIKIDPGRQFDDVEDVDIEWGQTLPQPESADLNKNEMNVLMDAIWWAIPRNNPKLRRRFKAFLKCSKEAEIAIVANTTKQNIQKQFQSIIRRVHRILSESGLKTGNKTKPLDFKKKVMQA
jgi:hypothetical protein